MTWRQPSIAVVAAAAVVAALALLDAGPNVPVVAALVVAGCAASWALRRVGSALAPGAPAVEAPEPPDAHPDLRITTLRQALAAGGADARIADRVYRQLVAVVDDELQAAHGIVREHDREAARAVLDPALFRFVDEPEHAVQLDIRGLERIVTRIEAL